MKVYLHAIGCRLNQSEMESLGRQLLAAGHQVVDEVAQADRVVVNTCAVTAAAAGDARRLIRRLHREHGAAQIVLTGCYATLAPHRLAGLPGAGPIVSNADKDRLLPILDPEAAADAPVFDREPVLRAFLAGGTGHTRAFVKVQDGCDNRCTFCVTTIARGPGRSRPLRDVVAEVQSLAAAGYREAVLTGVHLGSYGRDLGRRDGLTALVKALLDNTDISRLRLSSLEPWDLDAGFFQLWQHPRLLPHLHLPLQSGSDAVLRRMARRTSRADFRALAAAARDAIPDLNLSTDIIVGFPGETDAEFRHSLDFVTEIGFSRLHAFSYSARPGTAAARLPDQLPGPVKKERVGRMIALGRRLSHDFHRRFEGRVLPVLWETAVGANGQGGRWIGYTDNYIRVLAAGPPDLANRVTEVLLGAARPDGMDGAVVSGSGATPALPA